MTLFLNILSCKLIISISLGFFFLGFYFVLLFGAYSFLSCCLTFSFWFYELGKTSSGVEGLALCGSVPFVDCLCLVALAGLLELECSGLEAVPRGALCLRLHWQGDWGWISPRPGEIPGEHCAQGPLAQWLKLDWVWTGGGPWVVLHPRLSWRDGWCWSCSWQGLGGILGRLKQLCSPAPPTSERTPAFLCSFGRSSRFSKWILFPYSLGAL